MSTPAASAPATAPGRVDRGVGLALALVAAFWHAQLMTRATNDNFLHLTFAQQWLHGDWPVRDFFDQGWVLQYALSAAAQRVFGDRLAGEAVIVGIAWAISTFLVFGIVRRLAGSLTIAVASALLPIVLSARGYSYPKGIVYAVAALLWWRYVERPSVRRAIALGGWTAVAFYWRPDHGVYTAVAVALAVIAAHGVTPLAVRRGLAAGATALACLLPFIVYVQAVYGLGDYVRTGMVQAEVEHESHGTHEWPVLRYASTLVVVEPAEHFAPTIGIRWRADSTERERAVIRQRYDLATVGRSDGGSEQVRLSAAGVAQVRPLINEPLIDDTAGIDRAAGVLLPETWPAWSRWRFTHPLLRLQVLPELDADARATEWMAATLLLFPLLLILGGPWIGRRLDRPPAHLMAFGAFALLVAWVMIRNPFAARIADAVVLSAIAFGCGLGSLWRRRGDARGTPVVRRALSVGVAAIVVLLSARAGRFDNPADWPADAVDASRELTAAPPLSFYVDRPARFTLRLAAYIRDCVPADDRLLVLWFEPEIYYYADRLMAQRHLVFAPEWAALEREQRATLAKIARTAPPIVLARRSALDSYARATYPGVIDYVTREYHLAATVPDAGEEYLIYARRDRPVIRTFDGGSWPCYTAAPSRWARAGHPVP